MPIIAYSDEQVISQYEYFIFLSNLMLPSYPKFCFILRSQRRRRSLSMHTLIPPTTHKPSSLLSGIASDTKPTFLRNRLVNQLRRCQSLRSLRPTRRRYASRSARKIDLYIYARGAAGAGSAFYGAEGDAFGDLTKIPLGSGLFYSLGDADKKS